MCVCVCVCVCQFECVSERVVIRKRMSHFTGCGSPLSPSLSLSGGQQWKWARPCSKCGDLVANPALFPTLSPLNDAYCILPRRRRRRRRKGGWSWNYPSPPSLFAPISHYGGSSFKEQSLVIIVSSRDVLTVHLWQYCWTVCKKVWIGLGKV